MPDLPIEMVIFAGVTSAFLFAGIFLPIFAIFRYPVPDEAPIHRQIAKAVGVDQETIFENAAIAPILSLFVQLAKRVNLTGLRAGIRQNLQASGNPSGYTVDQVLALAMASAVVVGGFSSMIALLINGGLLLLFLPTMSVVGFLIPLFVLSSSATRRARRIGKQLPYTLDLIALVMASGSSFTEAVETLIRDDPEDDLNQELAFSLSEMEYGTTRAQALMNLGVRIPLDSLRSVIGAVNQAEKLGTPLSSILKVQAEMLRMHRSVRAEKLSASASLKILVPSMLILLAVVLVIGAPMIIRFIVQGSLW
ncbi:MAG: type II secretion system F family protein [Phycisphaeraceae bacterium]